MKYGIAPNMVVKWQPSLRKKNKNFDKTMVIQKIHYKIVFNLKILL